MSNTQFASGPWVASKTNQWRAENNESGWFGSRQIDSKNGDVIAVVIADFSEGVTREDLAANAALIAAAPELYSALESLLSVVKDSTGVSGYHLNGDIAAWDEFEEIQQAASALLKASRNSKEAI